MTFEELLTELKSMGDPKALAHWQRLNLQSRDIYLGTGMTKLKDRAKKLPKSHELSMECWRSNVYDAKMIACFLDEPKKIFPQEADEVIQGIDVWGLGDQYVKNQVAKTTFRVSKAEQWVNDKQEYVKRAGYQLIQILAKEDKSLPDSWFEVYLSHIEKLQSESNWIKEMMAYTLMAIGTRSKALHTHALAIAQQAGKIEVDYGDTSCQSPDPVKVLSGKF